jgi:hypothetical protein
MFLTREQVAVLKLSEATQALTLLTTKYNLDDPLTAEVWPVLDDVVNTLLYLEDHIHRLGDPRYAIQNEALLDDVELDDLEIDITE